MGVCCETEDQVGMVSLNDANRPETIFSYKEDLNVDGAHTSDKDDWKGVKVPDRVLVTALHEHPLQYIADLSAVQEGDGEWCCNGVEIFKSGCKSGQSDLGLQSGIKCWRSTDEQSDFDLCE